MPGLIWFEWQKCPDGYTIEEFKPQYEDQKEGKSLEGSPLADMRPPWVRELVASGERSRDTYDQDLGYDETQEFYFVPKTKNSLRFFPLEENTGAFMEFANCGESTDAALAFVSKYGYPTQKPWGEHIKFFRWEAFQELACEMAEAIDLWQEARRNGDYGELADEFNQEYATFPDMLPKVPVSVQLRKHWDSGALPQLCLVPSDLSSALNLQFAQAVTGDQKLKKCAACQSWYAFGPGTGRRETATYCSPKCRKASNYRQKKEKGQ